MTCYLLRTEAGDRAKIGWSTGVEARIKLIQAGCWETLVLARTWDGSRLVEAWLHRRFERLNIAREWFRWSDEMMTIEPPSEDVLRESRSKIILVRAANPSSLISAPSGSHGGLSTPRDIEREAKKVGLSITDICKRAGIQYSTFSRWKSGKTAPNITTYAKIETVLSDAGVDL